MLNDRESPDREVMYSVRWMNGFAEEAKALPVSEQDFSASMFRRLKISLMMSSGRLGSPSSYVIIGRGLGSPHSLSQRDMLDLDTSVPNPRVVLQLIHPQITDAAGDR